MQQKIHVGKIWDVSNFVSAIFSYPNVEIGNIARLIKFSLMVPSMLCKLVQKSIQGNYM